MTRRRLRVVGDRDHAAITALRALPGDHVIGTDTTGVITAALAEVCVRNGHADPGEVLALLQRGGMFHPGTGGTP